MSTLLTRTPLQEISADVLAYGAKDTGEMGGGAANAMLVAAGPALRDALRQALSASPRTVGTTIFTKPFDLAPRGVKFVCHIVSIIKDTPKGAYCPEPQKLRSGVLSALKGCQERGVASVALSALGTGEGCVPAQEAARLMLGAISDFSTQHPSSHLSITLSLPTFDDYEAFRTRLEGFTR